MKTFQIQLNDAQTGRGLGTVAVTHNEYAWIEAHAQRPPGIFRADALAPEEWSRLHLRPEQTVYFDPQCLGVPNSD